MSDTHIEGLEEIAKQNCAECDLDINDPESLFSFQLDDLIKFLADPAIGPYVPAVKALQEEVDRLKYQELKDTITINKARHKIATLEATNAAQAERIGGLEVHLAESAANVIGWCQKIEQLEANNYHDAYRGAYDRARLAEMRLKAAEVRIKEQAETLENLWRAHNAENGPTFMGEPVFPKRQSSTPAEYQLAGGEAVAWMAESSRFRGDFCLTRNKETIEAWIELGIEPVPLYTAAPAIKQQVAESAESVARRIVDVVMFDLDGRKGVLDGVDSEVRDEMAEELSDLIVEALAPTHPVSANQPDGGKVPPGYVLVPVEITPEMEKAWQDAFNMQLGRRLNKNRRLKRHLSGKQDQSCETVAYRAMLAAASAPIAEQVGWGAGITKACDEFRDGILHENGPLEINDVLHRFDATVGEFLFVPKASAESGG